MNWNKAEKIMNVLAIIAIIIAVVWLIFMSIALFNMIEDHNCYIDGYQSQKCQKYIRNK